MFKKLSTLSILFMGILVFNFIGIMPLAQTAKAEDNQNAISLEEVQAQITGLWRYKHDNNTRFYFFGMENIDLGTNNTRSTVELDQNNDVIMNLSVLATNEKSGPQAYKLLKVKKNRILLKNQYGEEIILKRVNREIITLKGTLAFRERIALPENVAVRVNLYADGELLTTKAFQSDGTLPIPFAIHFLGKKKTVQETQLSFTAAIYSNFQTIFETKEPLLVTENYITVSNFKLDQEDQDKDGSYCSFEIEKRGESFDIMLYQSTSQTENTQQNSPNNAELSENEPLQNTYWRLISLNGKDIVVSDNMPEPHLVIKGEQAHGSDGCNQYNLPIATLENTDNANQNRHLSFKAGASTMMLCHEGEEQALEFMQSLATIDNYAISDAKLYLNEDLDTKLIFEATPLK